MPKIPKAQTGVGGEGAEDQLLSGDYFLLYLVLFLLAVFYVGITYILKDANSDREKRLENLSKAKKA
jgi:ABC-type arginine/histidine transport system permease subunit